MYVYVCVCIYIYTPEKLSVKMKEFCVNYCTNFERREF